MFDMKISFDTSINKPRFHKKKKIDLVSRVSFRNSDNMAYYKPEN